MREMQKESTNVHAYTHAYTQLSTNICNIKKGLISTNLVDKYVCPSSRPTISSFHAFGTYFHDELADVLEKARHEFAALGEPLAEECVGVDLYEHSVGV